MYCILVVYNQSVTDSPSYQYIKKRTDFNLIVCDNSTQQTNNQSLVESDHYTYIDMQGNRGLSKAYNAALDTIKEKEGWVVLLDDDTKLNDSYIQSIKHLDKNTDIYIPTCKR